MTLVRLLGCAQLGVPAAVVALGLSDHVLSPGQAAAIIAAALITLGASAIGAELLARHPDGPQADSRAHPEAARPS